MHTRRTIVLLTYLACLCAGCTARAASTVQVDQSPLANTGWQLVAFGDPQQLTPVVAGSVVTIIFDAQRQIASGQSGCNDYGGPYRADQSQLTISRIDSAAHGCASVPLMQQEQQVQRALLAVHSYRMASGRLELTYDDGKIMQWTKP